MVLLPLFCPAGRKDSVSLSRFPFHNHIQVFSCEISLICHLKFLYSCFSFHFCFLVVLMINMFALLLVAVISISSGFLCSLRVLVWMHPCYLQYLRILFFLLFFTHTVFPCPHQEWSRVSYKRDSPGVFHFVKILVAELGFETFSRLL